MTPFFEKEPRWRQLQEAIGMMSISSSSSSRDVEIEVIRKQEVKKE